MQYGLGDAIKLNEADFIRLATAFFAKIESKYCRPTPIPSCWSFISNLDWNLTQASGVLEVHVFLE